MTTFDIRLFGAIEIRRDGELITDFRSQKALVLLAFLICENRPVTRDYLAGLGWPEMEQSQALGLLRRSLHDLNSQLPGCLALDRRTVCFSPTAPATIDIHTLTTLLALNDFAGWTASAAFYHAPFLHGIYVDAAPELESWLLRQQEHWQQAATRTLQHLIQHHTDTADYDRALRYVQQLLALEPWREEVQRQAMLLLARSGQVSAALAQYERCRHILQTELAVEPSPATALLYARINALVRTPSPNLLAATTPFIGRAEEVAELLRLLANPSCRLLTVVGPGGMGKTRLALEVARQAGSEQRRVFLHGVRFVALAGSDRAAQFVSALAQALPFTVQPQSPPDEQLFNYLHDKELLLLLDNFEHLIDTACLAFVTNLLQRAPDVKVLITSRVRLNVQGEQLYWLQGLQFPIAHANPEAVKLNELGQYSSMQLFMATAQRVQSASLLAPEDVLAIAAICQLVQGMPLAIELAAAWTNVLSPAKIVMEMKRTLDFLTSELHDLPLRQRSMRVVFDTSWRLLTETEQAVFQQLSVFRSGFTREAAQAVTGASLPILVGLVHKAFLYRTPTERFEVHELLRQFAHEQLSRNHELAVTQQRHTDYFVGLAEEGARHFTTSRLGQWIECLECEHDNLRAVLNWALAHKAIVPLLRLACALQRFWDYRGYYIDMNHWLEQGLMLAEQTWGDLSTNTDETGEAPVSDRLSLVAQALFARAEALMHDRENAEVLYNRSLRLDQRIGPTPLSIGICQALTWIERRRGNFYRADELQHTILHLAETLPDFQGEERQRKIAYAIGIGSVNALYQADLARSATLAAQSLAQLDVVEDRHSHIYMAFVLGHIALRENNFARAYKLLADCYRQFSEAGNTDGVVFLRCHLSILALRQGDWQRARSAFLENLTWLQHYNKDHDALLYNLRGLADAVRQQGNFVLAAKLLGAIEKLRQLLKCTIPPIYQPDFEETLMATRSQLDTADFAAAYAQGYAMTLEQAVAFALANG